MPGVPGDHLGVFVGGVVVEDDVHGLGGRDGFLHGIEEADELLMAVALHASPHNLAVQHVEGSEQRGRAVALVIMRHRAGAAALHRQARLGAVERLDLALLVDRQDHRVSGRVDIQADDVADLGREQRVVQELEGPNAVRLEPVRTPDTLDIGEADARRLDHGASRPMGSLAWRLGTRQSDDPLADLGAERRDPRWAGLVAEKALHAFPGEVLLPTPDRRLALGSSPHDGRRAEHICCRQHDRGPPDMLLRLL